MDCLQTSVHRIKAVRHTRIFRPANRSVMPVRRTGSVVAASRRTKENLDSIPSVGVTELASIVVTTMADDEVEFMQTDVFVNYCVYLCVQ